VVAITKAVGRFMQPDIPTSIGITVRRSNPNRISLIVLVSILVLGSVWALASAYAVPPLIRRAYNGRSLPIFNRMISGQSSQSVGEYLAKWNGRSRRVLVDFVLLGFLTLLALRPEFQRVLTKVASSLFRYRLFRFAVCALVVFLSIELPSRAILSFEPIFDRIKSLDDSSRRLAWIKSQKVAPKGASSYSYLTYSAMLGWAVRPGIHDAIVFGNKSLNTNSKGIRGNLEYDYKRQPGRLRIMTLGDSFTFGDEISDDETYSTDLAAILPNTEVLNLGVSGYGHDQMLLYLQEEGIKYRPDVVILGYVSLDADRNLRSFNAFAKPKFELSHGQLRLTGVPVPTAAEVLAREPYQLKCLDLAVMLRETVRVILGNKKSAHEISSAIFDELVKTVRNNGAVPVFVYMPVLHQIIDPREGLTTDEEFLDSYCQRRGVACLFLRPYFREQIKKGATFNVEIHWDPQAHRLAAQAMRDFLLEKRILPVGVKPVKRHDQTSGEVKREVVQPFARAKDSESSGNVLSRDSGSVTAGRPGQSKANASL